MPVSDLDIARSAHQWIQLHGDDAIARAREMVEAMKAEISVIASERCAREGRSAAQPGGGKQ